MIRNGVSVTIFSDKAKDKGPSETFDNIQVLHVNQLFWLPIIKRRKMLTLLEESHADVILLSGRPLSCLSLSRLSKVKKPIIWMIEAGVHDVRSVLRLSAREFWNRDHTFLWNDILNALFPRRLIRRVANSSSIAKIVVPSHLMREWFLRIGVLSGKVVVIESALDEYFREFAKLAIDKGENTLGLDKRHLVVTYAGSPCTIRGSDTFVRGVQIVLAKGRVDLRCLILSRRPIDNSCPHLRREEEYLRKLVTKLGLTDVVTMIPGILHRHRLTALIQASDIVVFPFKLLQSEIPLSVLEVMSLGKVVVTTRIRTLQEIAAGNRALLIEPEDHHALAKAVLDVVDHDKRTQEIRMAAQKFACSLPSWEKVGEKTFSIIRAAVQSGSEQRVLADA
jgi:glycosyltransferase involved in cell wall biosynthesis